MYSPSFAIRPDDYIGEIVSRDYRTADVFKKYGIEFCCGAKRTLRQVCEMNGIDAKNIEIELNNSIRDVRIPSSLAFSNWSVDFLIDYIIKLHHEYVKQAFPEVLKQLEHFVEGHKKKYPYMIKVQSVVQETFELMNEDMEYEERTIFPYVRQINNALRTLADYGALLVRTMRKPVDKTLESQRESLFALLQELRTYTNNYKIPEGVCLSYKVIMQKLQEIDNDLIQHIYLENSVLLPKVVNIEKQLLQSA